MRRRTAVVAVAGLLAATSASALCIWDTDTLRDEMQTKADDFDLITGQFPHHGTVYYEARVKQAQTNLAAQPDDIVARNDLGVALLKLGRFDESLAEFNAIREQQPGKYETLSNLGVLHKKWGKFAKAAEFTKQALAIKPEGHLGLGDYYLMMLTWQALEATNPASPPALSYFGTKYGKGGMHAEMLRRYDPVGDDGEERPSPARADPKRIRALVRSDRTFADGILMLADQLASERELNLALWGYLRARQLNHPNPAAIQSRIDWVFRHWNEAVGQGFGKGVESQASAVAGITAELVESQTWREQFETVEGELIEANGLAAVDFKTVEAELERRGIERFRPSRNFGVVGALSGRALPNPIMLIVGLLVVVLVALFTQRVFRKRRSKPAAT